MKSSSRTTNASGSSSAGRHPIYRGIRRRSNGKWVSEIREPKTPNRIWLGTFPTPEMAAIAYDVASRALKGEHAELNFPNSAASFPLPDSRSPRDIQAAAASAAAAYGAAKDALSQGDMVTKEDTVVPVEALSPNYDDLFIDEKLLFDFPNVLADMSEGILLLQPPHLEIPSDDP
ncbi:hypothetical protein ACFE04_003182 [Oxalis oulophora]